MKCANHPDRGGILAVDLPSINVRTFLCLECRIELNDQFARMPNERKQNPWPSYPERDDRSTDGRLLRHEYDGTLSQHTLDRSKE